MIKLNKMQRCRFFPVWISLAAFLSGCAGTPSGDEPEKPALQRAVNVSGTFAGADGDISTRAESFLKFEKDDRIIIYAAHSENPGDNTMSANFMKDQIVDFDGSAWTYSPLKYWPQNGSLYFRAYYPAAVGKDIDKENFMLKTTHKCITGFERLYRAEAHVNAENNTLSGDVSGNGNLRLGFTPLLNTVNFTAKVEDNLFHEVDSDEYVDCHFLLLSFNLYGFYKQATYTEESNSWTPYRNAGQYTEAAPLDMTGSLQKQNIQQTLDGYTYDPSQGYFTESAVIIGQGDGKVNIFGNTLHLIPRDNRIGPPGIKVTYVVLTHKTDSEGNKVYKESGIITRNISLSKILNTTGLVKKQININLDFSIDAVTVTRNLEDYTFKEMF